METWPLHATMYIIYTLLLLSHLCRVPTVAAWTTGAAIAFLFVSDWKVVTKRIPFIKDKYDHEIPK